MFHIGLHKTGTTWFQKQFYPRVAGYRLVERRLVRSVLLAQSPLAFNAAAARKALGLDEGAPAILCEEDLSGVLHNGGLLTDYVAKEIARELHAIAPDAKVVIFVRNQVSMAASLYQQYVREGGTSSVRHYLFPEDYLHLGRIRPLKVPRFDFSALEYDRLIAHYDSLFGRERVFAFAYEHFARDAPAFLSDFCAELGIAMPSGIDRRRLNSSYRAGLIPVARFLNLFTRRSVADKIAVLHIPYWYPARKLLLDRLNRLPLFGRVPAAENVLGSQVSGWIRQRFAESNRALQERLGVNLEELGYATGQQQPLLDRPTRSALLRWMKN
jgi:sulfotransferase family protein